jgi:hypothetical protein
VAPRRISAASGSERDFVQEIICRERRALPLAALIRRGLTFQYDVQYSEVQQSVEIPPAEGRRAGDVFREDQKL